MKPVRHARQSNNIARSIQLALLQIGTQLYDLLFAFMSRRIYMFSFVEIEGRYYGCHDFV